VAELRIVPITGADGLVAEPDWLVRAEAVHRQLRPAMGHYASTMARVFAGGARMVVAVADGAVRGVAVYRAFADTANGLKFYVDDLVTDEACRGQGVGRRLMDKLSETAKAAGAGSVVLDSGTQRTRAHAFYFREGFVITSFNFKKSLS